MLFVAFSLLFFTFVIHLFLQFFFLACDFVLLLNYGYSDSWEIVIVICGGLLVLLMSSE